MKKIFDVRNTDGSERNGGIKPLNYTPRPNVTPPPQRPAKYKQDDRIAVHLAEFEKIKEKYGKVNLTITFDGKELAERIRENEPN